MRWRPGIWFFLYSMSVRLLQAQNRNSSIPPAAKNFLFKQQRPGNESHGFPAAGCSLLKLQPQSPILPSVHSSAKPAGYIFTASHSGYAADGGTNVHWVHPDIRCRASSNQGSHGICAAPCAHPHCRERLNVFHGNSPPCILAVRRRLCSLPDIPLPL